MFLAHFRYTHCYIRVIRFGFSLSLEKKLFVILRNRFILGRYQAYCVRFTQSLVGLFIHLLYWSVSIWIHTPNMDIDPKDNFAFLDYNI